MPATLETGSLINDVESALDSSPHLSRRRMRIEAFNGVVRLEGAVNTYFQKQIAQELLRRVDGVKRVENRLQVNW